MLPKVSILAIGDVHFPENIGDYTVDHKDKRISRSLVALATSTPITSIFREVLTLCNHPHNRPNALILCGDLTSKGDADGYHKCVNELNKKLNLATSGYWPLDHVHVVPGNHDVNRDEADQAPANDFNHKFTRMAQCWKDIGVDILPTNSWRGTEIIADGMKRCKIYSLNSCIGCQEKLYPEGMRTGLVKAIEEGHAAAADKAASLKLLHEDLDTPMFRESDIGDICDDIKKLPNTVLPIVLAHHNLLPQAIPRVASFSDLMNGGLARSRLLGVGRPILYCHGHIHTDPVDSIINCRVEQSHLLNISIPDISSGFSVINIAYGMSGQPIGCEVQSYTTLPHGGVEMGSATRVALLRSVNGMEINQIIPSILKYLSSQATGAVYLYPKLLAAITASPGSASISEPEFQAALSEAEWLGLVTISNRTAKPKFWQVRGILS